MGQLNRYHVTHYYQHHREDLSVPQPLMFAKYDNPGLETLVEEIESIETYSF